MKREMIALLVALAAASATACSQNDSYGSPTGPSPSATSGGGAPTVKSIADEPAKGGFTNGVANSCTDEAPTPGYANTHPGEGGTVDFGWYKLGGATGYEVEVQRLVNNDWVKHDSFGTDGNASVMAYRQIDGTPSSPAYPVAEYRFRVARKANANCGPGTPSTWVLFAVGGRAEDPPACWKPAFGWATRSQYTSVCAPFNRYYH